MRYTPIRNKSILVVGGLKPILFGDVPRISLRFLFLTSERDWGFG